ncbi:MAG: hypothetical protein DBX40_00290 [Clostridiales bacterium]|nr:MAG: hypothetical protein DBX40_00290 [Clostridiales bacterium]
MTIKDAINDEAVSYYELYDYLLEHDIGYWNDVNSSEILYDYINDMMRQGYRVSHMLKAMERQFCETQDWHIALDNSANTPKAIKSKEDLAEALYLSDDDLRLAFEPEQGRCAAQTVWEVEVR